MTRTRHALWWRDRVGYSDLVPGHPTTFLHPLSSALLAGRRGLADRLGLFYREARLMLLAASDGIARWCGPRSVTLLPTQALL